VSMDRAVAMQTSNRELLDEDTEWRYRGW
jgi:hypothetical protein